MHNDFFPSGRNQRNRDFGKLLAQYVFCVAETFIEQADAQTQQKLIRLFIDADQEPGREDAIRQDKD